MTGEYEEQNSSRMDLNRQPDKNQRKIIAHYLEDHLPMDNSRGRGR
jgi:hypothetical protein